MNKTCSTRGCPHPAVWEIEVMGTGVESTIYHACDECYRRWEEVLLPVDVIRKLPGGLDGC